MRPENGGTLRKFVLFSVVAVVVALGTWVWLGIGSGEPSTPVPDPTPVAPPPGATVFVIDPSRSLASFEIREELRGSPNIVVGDTDQVSGQVTLDPSDLSTATLSEFFVNARTLQTDSARRDRAMRLFVLESAKDEFEFIIFRAVSIEGLEGEADLGDTVEFTVTGDMTIKGTTREVSFEVSAQLVDWSTLEGSATTRIRRSDFGISIPAVPGVANVGDEVILYLDFVAVSG